MKRKKILIISGNSWYHDKINETFEIDFSNYYYYFLRNGNTVDVNDAILLKIKIPFVDLLLFISNIYCKAVLSMFGFSVLVYQLIQKIKPIGISGFSNNVQQFTNTNINSFNLELFLDISLEEIIFRTLPFIFIYEIFNRKPSFKLFIILAGILISIIFGYCHGNYLNVLVQGIGGFILWYTMYLVFMKINKYFTIFYSILLSMLVCIVIHYSFDFFIITDKINMFYYILDMYCIMSLIKIYKLKLEKK